MLLTIDIGNSNIVFGGFMGDSLDLFFRIKTRKELSKTEWAHHILKAFQEHKVKPNLVDNVIIASVVPEKQAALSEIIQEHLSVSKPYIVTYKSDFHITLAIEKLQTLGIDRAVNAAAAFEKYKANLIIVDVGTATTFDIVKDKTYIGGLIVPGPQTMKTALIQSASQLEKLNLHLEKPKNIIGKNTKDSIQSGLFYGYIGLIENILKNIIHEQKTDFIIVFTGGAAPLFIHEISHPCLHEPHLTLKGLKLVSDWNT
ncbi:MAG: type III pantothenate kinase [bacterium]|nr:type III pantothenate kinase [bacterium]MBU1917743.1 type III pantothenate kinase [bacterium]